MTDPLVATVAILTYNGEDYLERILTMVEDQVIDGDVEVLVIDSGSEDRTLEIVAAHPAVVLHCIPNSEFGHGRTRNLAAQLARGKYIAYLTHDAVPLSDSWLRELIEPFRMDERIVGVMGKQVPRPGCFPLMKYEIDGVFARFGPDFGTTIFYEDSFVTDDAIRGAITFYSDVNSAAKREFLIHTIAYRDVPYAEDQMFGQDIIAAGFLKAYAPRATVEHSNDLTYKEFGFRIFDETVGLRRIGTPMLPLRLRAVLRLTVRGAGADTMRILRDGSYSWKRKLYWLVINPFYQARKWWYLRKATIVDISDELAVNEISLEHRRKAGSKNTEIEN